MDKEKASAKIEKLLSLAGNNPSEKEAMTALYKARELMLQYDIDESSIGGHTKQEINWYRSQVIMSAPWKYRMADVISKYFRCRNVYENAGKSKRVLFVGYDSDASSALKVFEYTTELVNRKAGNLVQKLCTSKFLRPDGIKGDYIMGFISGLSNVWSQQDAKYSTALVLTVPVDVNDAVEAQIMSRFTITKHTVVRGDHQAVAAGYTDGTNFANGYGKERLA